MVFILLLSYTCTFYTENEALCKAIELRLNTKVQARFDSIKDDIKTVLSSADDQVGERLSRRLVKLTLGAVDPLAGAHTSSAGLLYTVNSMTDENPTDGSPYNIIRGSIYYSKCTPVSCI